MKSFDIRWIGRFLESICPGCKELIIVIFQIILISQEIKQLNSLNVIESESLINLALARFITLIMQVM